MANTTVYPYGTGGSLPSSIGLVNDLTTGGVNNALTADQGKVIGEVIGGVSKQVTCTDYVSGRLNAANGLTAFGTVETDSGRRVFGPVSCDGYATLTYPCLQMNADHKEQGLVFYDSNDNPIVGYPSFAGTSAKVSYTVQIPTGAAYFKLTGWSSDTSINVTLTTASKIEKPAPLINDFGAQFGFDLAQSTNVGYAYFFLSDGGVFSCMTYGTNPDARIYIDLTGRDYSKKYKLTLKYKYTGTATNVWCAYLTALRGTSQGSVFSDNANIPSGEGTLTTYITPSMVSCNYIQVSAQNAGLGYHLYLYGLQLEEVETDTPAKTYGGQKLSLENTISIKKMAVSGVGQGGAVYGDFLVTVNLDVSKLYVKDIPSGNTLAQLTFGTDIDKGFVSNAHFNTINFGSAKYDDSDDFPLLYCSTGYASDGYTGCIVYRMQMSESGGTYSFTFTIVQTIKIAITAWTEFMPGGNYLYVRNGTKIYKFTMPTLSDGATVTLDTANAIKEYTFHAQEFSPSSNQGHLYYNGKVYFASGTGASQVRTLCVLDLESQTWATVVYLDDIGLSSAGEPEFVFIYGGQLCIGFNGPCYMLFY